MAPQPDAHRRRGFWNALVAELRPLVADEVARRAEREGLHNQGWAPALRSWVDVAGNILQPYSVDLSYLLPLCDRLGPREAVFILSSFSLFRLRPYRRTIVWEEFSNDLLPPPFIKRFVLKQEADLSSGETAFAAFASSLEDYADGLVVGDGLRNLRGTYSVLDRLLGLRNNAFVPLRGRTLTGGRENLIAVVVASFPVPDVFPDDLPRRIAPICRKFEELFERLLQVEQLEEGGLLRERYRALEASDPGPAAIHRLDHLVPHPLPAAAMVTFDVDGGAQRVRALRATTRVGPEHLAQYAREEAELTYYGLDQFGLLGRHRPAPVAPVVKSDVVTLSTSVPSVFAGGVSRAAQVVLDAVVAAQERSEAVLAVRDFEPCTAEREHFRVELLRSLGQALCSYLSRGDHRARLTFLRYLSVTGVTGLPQVREALTEVRRSMTASREPDADLLLSLRTKRPVLVGNSEQHYLDALGLGCGRVAPPSAAPRAARTSLRDRMRIEFSTRQGLISFCRMLTCLAAAAAPGATEEFVVQQFRLLRDEQNGPLFSSLVFPDGARVRLERKDVDLSITISWLGEELFSSWRLEEGEMPLAVGTTCSSFTATFDSADYVSGPWPGQPNLFCEFVRRDAAAIAGLHSFNLPEGTAEQNAVLLISALDRAFPLLVDTVDSIEIIPLPIVDDALLSFEAWGDRNGEQDLFVMGGLRTWAYRADDIAVAPKLRCGDLDRNLDSLSARFVGLAAHIQRLEIDGRRRGEFHLLAQRLGRLGHDLKPEKIDVLLQDIDSAVPGPNSELLRRCRDKLSIIRDLMNAPPPGSLAFEDFAAHLPLGIVQAGDRIYEKLNVRPTTSAFTLAEALAAPGRPIGEVVELLSNVLANAYVASPLTSQRVAIETDAPFIKVLNRFADKAAWNEAVAVLLRFRQPRKLSGLSRIVELSSRLNVSLDATTETRAEYEMACVQLSISGRDYRIRGS